MVRTRQSHVAKTHAERKQYWETVIRTPIGPTLEDTAPIIDTTDQAAETEEKQRPSYELTEPPSRIGKFLREKGIELGIGVIALTVLGWGGIELYTLNREVGKFESDLTNMQKEQSEMKTAFYSEIEKMEKRLIGQIRGVSSDVDRLELRIDGLIDSGLQKKNE